MNAKCEQCKGKGILSRPGKGIGNGQPYDIVCGFCQGIGHYRFDAPRALADRLSRLSA